MKKFNFKAVLMACLMIICSLALTLGDFTANNSVKGYANVVLAAEPNQPERVKVGFFEFDGYHDIDSNGVRHGYGYDFLQMIAGFGNLEYEYVGYDKSWYDMLTMLDEGRIDMVTSARYTPERARHYDFSSSPVGYSETIMTTKQDDDRYIPGRPETYNGMVVGMLAGTTQNEVILDLAKKNGATLTPRYFKNLDEMYKALEEDDVDAIVTSSLRVLRMEKVLERFDRRPYYAIVKKGNIELLNRINFAINQLDSNNPEWRAELQNKYYSTNAAYFSLAVEEKAYLDNLRKNGRMLKVLINPDLKPYSYFEDGYAKGILVDFFDEVCNFYNLKHEYIQTATAEEYYYQVKSRSADIILAPNSNRFEADSMGYFLTRSFLKAPICVITTHDKRDLANSKIAVVSGMSTLVTAVEYNFPTAEVVKFKTTRECIDAVKNGDVAGAMIYNYSAFECMNGEGSDQLQVLDVPYGSIGFSVSVQKGANPNFYTLMNKGLGHVDNTKLQSFITKNTLESVKRNETIWSYIYRKPLLLFSLLGLAAAGVLFCIWRRYQAMKSHQMEKRLQAEFEASHDALTGALNRVAYDAIVDNPQRISKKLGVIMLDIDYFKGINDSYSHEMGDKALVTLTNLLQTLFHDKDIIIRLGGDEFIILMQDVDRSVWDVICRRLNVINNGISNILPDSSTVTISAGLVFTEHGFNKNLTKLADEGLYNTKNNGRAGCTMLDDTGKVLDFWRDESIDYSVLHAMEQAFLCPWKIELSKDFSVRKLFGHSTMMETLNVPLGTSPEKTYKVFYDAIDDAYKSKMEQMIVNMLAGETLELIVPWQHPSLGRVHLRVGGAKVENTISGFDGHIMMGYYQILNDVYFMNTDVELRGMIELINQRAANCKDK